MLVQIKEEKTIQYNYMINDVWLTLQYVQLCKSWCEFEMSWKVGKTNVSKNKYFTDCKTRFVSNNKSNFQVQILFYVA